jgi:osmotically-inducible protein OsmY
LLDARRGNVMKESEMSSISIPRWMAAALCAALVLGCAAGGPSAVENRKNPKAAGQAGSDWRDAGITTRIKTAYLFNPHLSATAIHVTTENGVVALSGAVPSAVHRDLAVEIAKNAEGVRDVRNELTVGESNNPSPAEREDHGGTSERTFGQAVHDATLTASVKMALATNKGVKATDLNVDTRNSVVTLTGQVATQAEKQLALRIAKDTDGVRKVVDQIQIAKR